MIVKCWLSLLIHIPLPASPNQTLLGVVYLGRYLRKHSWGNEVGDMRKGEKPIERLFRSRFLSGQVGMDPTGALRSTLWYTCWVVLPEDGGFIYFLTTFPISWGLFPNSATPQHFHRLAGAPSVGEGFLTEKQELEVGAVAGWRPPLVGAFSSAYEMVVYYSSYMCSPQNIWKVKHISQSHFSEVTTVIILLGFLWKIFSLVCVFCICILAGFSFVLWKTWLHFSFSPSFKTARCLIFTYLRVLKNWE